MGRYVGVRVKDFNDDGENEIAFINDPRATYGRKDLYIYTMKRILLQFRFLQIRFMMLSKVYLNMMLYI